MDAWRSWHFKQDNFVWDVANYYSYLPAKFCNNNSFDFKNGKGDFLPVNQNGQKMPKVTYGMSLLYSPFFALGYKVAINSKEEPLDGFSEAFANCIHWGSIIYVILGLIFLRKFLLKFHSELVVTITLAVCFFGTLLFYYTYANGEMTHGYLFFLISSFLLLTYNWYLKATWFKSALIGLLIGLISLIRPTEVLVGLIFIFWNVKGKGDIKRQMVNLWSSKWHLVLTAVVAFTVWIPQFLFWKSMTGSYLYFSYGDERFFWGDPQILNILFSYRKGWITYTPLIVLAFVGFFFMRGSSSGLRWPVLALLVINVYVLSCWWDWFFGGCFGARGFCHHIAFLSLPIAAIIEFFANKENFKPVLRFSQTLFFAFIFLGICLNMGQTSQYIKGYIHFNSMSKETYWHVFGKYYLDGPNNGYYWKSLKEPDYKKLKSGEDRDQ